jgi:hypothetical protein
MDEELRQRLAELENLFRNHTHNNLDSPEITEINYSLLGLPTKLKTAPRPSITTPAGGATIDAEARVAINSIISALQALGLIQ